MSPGPGSRVVPKPDRLREKTDYRRGQKRLDLAWRMAVKHRDRWICQLCGIKVRITIEFCAERAEAHHIYPKGAYPELRCEVENGVTLCLTDHRRVQVDKTLLSDAVVARAECCYRRIVLGEADPDRLLR